VGSGTPRATTAGPPRPDRPLTPPPRHSCAPPLFLRRQEPRLSHTSAPPFPNSSLPPLRGEVRWGVGRREPPPPVPHAPIAHPLPLPVIPAPLPVIPAQAGTQAISSVRRAPQHPDVSLKPPLRRRTFKAKTRDAHHAGSCLRRNDGGWAHRNDEIRNATRASSHLPPTASPTPHPFPIHPSPLPGGRLGGGWDAASGRRRCSGFLFFGVIRGDPSGLPIWSGRSAVFGFVRICSGLFGMRRRGTRE